MPKIVVVAKIDRLEKELRLDIDLGGRSVSRKLRYFGIQTRTRERSLSTSRGFAM